MISGGYYTRYWNKTDISVSFGLRCYLYKISDSQLYYVSCMERIPLIERYLLCSYAFKYPAI